ncbi:hypothetical protein [Actinacidiphila glaucinigra]|uniref:hypothetical protein n=1 Tax=Actinacidiphila glaucinigra TaxID=235986 RepID=UPI003D91A809
MFGGDLTARTDLMISLGFPDHDIAPAIAAHQNAGMGRAILAVYRSAAQPAMAEAGRKLNSAAAQTGVGVAAHRRLLQRGRRHPAGRRPRRRAH